jgi:hypothetical protein
LHETQIPPWANNGTIRKLLSEDGVKRHLTLMLSPRRSSHDGKKQHRRIPIELLCCHIRLERYKRKRCRHLLVLIEQSIRLPRSQQSLDEIISDGVLALFRRPEEAFWILSVICWIPETVDTANLLDVLLIGRIVALVQLLCGCF